MIHRVKLLDQGVLGKLGRHCKYMLGFVRVARQLYMGKHPKCLSDRCILHQIEVRRKSLPYYYVDTARFGMVDPG